MLFIRKFLKIGPGQRRCPRQKHFSEHDPHPCDLVPQPQPGCLGDRPGPVSLSDHCPPPVRPGSPLSARLGQEVRPGTTSKVPEAEWLAAWSPQPALTRLPFWTVVAALSVDARGVPVMRPKILRFWPLLQART